MRIAYSPARIRAALVAIAIALTALGALMFLLTSPNGAELDSQYYRASLLLNSGAEASIANFYSAVQLAVCAALAAAIALAKRDRGERYVREWAGLVLVFAFMALDEGASLHEATIDPIRNGLGTHGLLLYAWVIPWGIAVLVLAVVYMRFFRDLPRRIRAPFTLAAVAFVGAAIGLEMVEGLIGDASTTAYAAAVIVEELIEMLALATFVYALLVELGASAGTLRLERA